MEIATNPGKGIIISHPSSSSSLDSKRNTTKTLRHRITYVSNTPQRTERTTTTVTTSEVGIEEERQDTIERKGPDKVVDRDLPREQVPDPPLLWFDNLPPSEVFVENRRGDDVSEVTMEKRIHRRSYRKVKRSPIPSTRRKAVKRPPIPHPSTRRNLFAAYTEFEWPSDEEPEEPGTPRVSFGLCGDACCATLQQETTQDLLQLPNLNTRVPTAKSEPTSAYRLV